MGRVRYAKSEQDHATDGAQARVGRVRTIRCRYETDAEVIQAVVPKPLETHVSGEVTLSFSCVETRISRKRTAEVRSARFGVRVDYDDRPGSYLVTMPMSSEAEVVRLRERFGVPAKLAEITFSSGREGEGDGESVGETFDGPAPGQGAAVSAQVERMDVPYLAGVGKRVEDLGPRRETEIGYCMKAFPGCADDRLFDQDPLLVRLEWQHEFDRVWRLEGGLQLWESAYDPVADLPVRRLVSFEYAEGTTRLSGRALRPVPGEWLRPFLHQRYDDEDVEGVDV